MIQSCLLSEPYTTGLVRGGREGGGEGGRGEGREVMLFMMVSFFAATASFDFWSKACGLYIIRRFDQIFSGGGGGDLLA